MEHDEANPREKKVEIQNLNEEQPEMIQGIWARILAGNSTKADDLTTETGKTLERNG